MNIRVDQPHLESTYPSFTPHITLCALGPSTNLSIDTLRSAIPLETLPIDLDIQSVDIGDHYFRSVYLKVENTQPLAALHAHVHDTLSLTPRTPLFPHMSLCYISDDDAEIGEREHFFRDLVKLGRFMPREDGGVSLNLGAPGNDKWLSTFQATEVWIAKCDGPVASWTILDKIPLSKS